MKILKQIHTDFLVKCGLLLLFSSFISLTNKTLAAESTPSAPKDSIQNTFLVIRHIVLDGNHRTRRQTILRELTFQEGDSLLFDNLMKNLELSRNQMINTGLFNEVLFNIKNWVNDSVDIYISMKERWYFLPLPTLNLYDRNFNVWWVEHEHDLRYLQGGLRVYQKNLSGRNDELTATALFGFQRRFDVRYILPYFDKIQKHGFSIASSYTQSKSVTYALDSNKELIYEDVNAFQRKVFDVSGNIFYKPKFNYTYNFSLGYKFTGVTDTIAKLNPDYLLDGKTIQQYLYGSFTFTRDYRDIIAYPLRGNFFTASVTKLGFGLFDDVSIWQLSALFSQYVPLGKKWYFSTQDKIKFSAPTGQPYNLERGLGYGNDYVSGYEYYAIDGQSWGYAKLVLKNELLKINLPSAASNPFSKGANLPFAIYGKIYFDAGYVSNAHSTTENPLENQLLLGGGVGIDVTLVYDTSLRFEYSVNKKGEHGLFFHVNTYF